MFNIPQSRINEFARLFETHRVQISACDVYFQNIRMLNGRHTILTRDDYAQYYKNFTWDIPLETSPIDAFVPCDRSEWSNPPQESTGDEEVKLRPMRLFVVNQLIPEYQRIAKRVTSEELHKTLNATHPVIMAMDNNKVTLSDVIDDIFIYYCLFKYLDQIETIRIQIFSNMTPAIEYVVENMTADKLKRYMDRSKLDPEKIAKNREFVFFKPFYDKICEYYKENPDPLYAFDLDNLIDRLITNIVLKSDIYIILAIYLTASFAVADIKRGIDSPCVNYVREVLSVI